MSLETSIAALTTQAGLLLDLPSAVANTATAKIALIGAEYQARLSAFRLSAYVDQNVGLDTNPGTIELPLKTINRAIAMTPPGGFTTIYLVNSYHITETIEMVSGVVLITSATSFRHTLSFDRRSRMLGATEYRDTRGFLFKGSASLFLRGLDIQMPILDGIWTLLPASNFTPPIKYDWPASTINIHLVECNLNRPAACYSALISPNGLKQIAVSSVTMTGQSMSGWWSADQPNTAGVAPHTVADLQTNLTLF